MVQSQVKMDTPDVRSKRHQRLRKSHSMGGAIGRSISQSGIDERLPGAPDSPPPKPAGGGSRKKTLIRTDTQIIQVEDDHIDYGRFNKNNTRGEERNISSLGNKPFFINANPTISVLNSGQRQSDENVIGSCVGGNLDLLTVDSYKNTQPISGSRGGAFLSCPDLGTDEKTRVLHTSHSLHGSEALGHGSEALGHGSEALGMKPPSGRKNSSTRLTVPDILTTVTSPGDLPLPPGIHRHSAPELTEADLPPSPPPRKPPLAKSLSDTPPRRSESAKERSSCPKYDPHPAGLLQSYRSDPVFSGVLDFLYIGNLESAYNVRLRCKLGIGSILDLSNINPDHVPASKKNEVPCTCTKNAHTIPAILRLNMCESDLIDIQSHFPKINKFIEGARDKKKRVLVVCYTGANLSVLIVIQYLLKHWDMNLRKAYSQVMKGRSDIELSYAYFQLLQSIEKQLYPTSPQRRYAGSGLPHRGEVSLPKEAWSDC